MACSKVPIVNFKHIIAGWVVIVTTISSLATLIAFEGGISLLVFFHNWSNGSILKLIF